MLLRRKPSHYVLIGNLPQAEASLLCTVGNLASQAFLFVCFVGLQKFWAGFGERFWSGFWCAYLPTILVCWLSDAFGTRFHSFGKPRGIL